MTLVYRIRIDVYNPSHELVPGMPADATLRRCLGCAVSEARSNHPRGEWADKAVWCKVAAVDGLSFAVSRGEIFGLVGPDGAGKTTTMRMLAGVMQPDAGRILVDGVDVVADPEAGKQHLSYMPQRFGLYEDLTVDENIRFYADLFEVPDGDPRRNARRVCWPPRA